MPVTRKGVGAAVSGAEITDLTVDTADLADNAVTQAKVADNAIGTAEIIAANVTAAKVAADVATQAELDAVAAAAQPLDGDLTAIAALTTTAYGRSWLATADAAAARTLADALRDEAGAVTDANLASPNNSAYKLLADWRGGVLTDGTAAATYYFAGGPSSGFVAAGTTLTPSASLYLNPADFTIAGLTTKYRIRGQWITNTQAAPAVTVTFALYAVTGSAGVADLINLTADTVPVTDSTAAIASPAVSTPNSVASADFTAPAAGHYALGFLLSGTATADSRGQLLCSLQVRNT